MKVLIDTNIFLSLYTSHQEKIAIFDDLKKIESHLFFPEQIVDEFYRNRDSQLSSLTSNMKGQNFRLTTSSSFIREFPEFEDLNTQCEDCEKIKTEIIKKLNIDPILQKFKELSESQNITSIKVTEDIINRAHNRYLRGNPPKSNKSDAIADEIIWELILSNISDDLLIVTGDQTYSDHKTFLKREFSIITGKELSITNKLADAIKIIGQIPSKATEDFDEENQKQKVLLSEWIQSYYFPDQSILARNVAAMMAGLSIDQSTLVGSAATMMAGMNLDQASIARSAATMMAGMNLDQASFASSAAAMMAGMNLDQSTLVKSAAAMMAGMNLDQVSFARSAATMMAGMNFDQAISERLLENVSVSTEISAESQKIKCPVCKNIINPGEKCQICGHSKNIDIDGDQEEE